VSEMISKSLFAAAAACLLVGASAHAQDNAATTAPAASESGDGITLELNKIEKSEKGCRAYVVVTNPTSTAYDAFKLDLVMFQTDGIVGRRFALDLSPVRPDKRSVKLFDLDGAQCDQIGSFLINDVMDCRTSSGPATDCLARLKVKSLTKVEISK
jgi:hypothetical protein